MQFILWFKDALTSILSLTCSCNPLLGASFDPLEVYPDYLYFTASLSDGISPMGVLFLCFKK